MTTVRRLAQWGLGLLVGCEAGAFEDYPSLDPMCPPDRARFDAQCCPAWTIAEGGGCRLRPWQTGDPEDARGDPGARDPELAIDGADLAVVAWESATGTQSILWVAEETGDGHTDVRHPAAALEGDAVTPAVAAHPDGRAEVSWKQQAGSDGAIHRSSRATTGGWTDPTPRDALSWPGNAYEPRVAFGPGDETIFVWNQWTGHNFRVLVSRQLGDDLDPPVLVSPPVNFANAPQVAVAHNGDAVVTWYQAGDQDLMVFGSERTRQSGEWTRPGPTDVLSAPGAPVASHPESNPIAAIDARGRIVIAWAQDNGAGATPLYIATRDGLGEWSTPHDLSDSFGRPDVVARGPRIATGPRGEMWLAWSEDVGDHHRVVAALRGADGEWVQDGRDPAVLSAEGADAIEPALAVGPDAEAVVVFSELQDGRRRIVARRRPIDGTRWLNPDVLSGDIPEDATEPAVAIGPGGRAIAVWVQGPPLAGRVRLAWVD